MKAKHILEEFAITVNDLDNRLPKSRGRCFDIGIWGGCGMQCPAIQDMECDEPEETIKRATQEEILEFIENEIYVDICKKYLII